nr:hypothetical protein [Tanacetum cinerariifolium]
MIAILEKSEHNVDFHQIVDFVEASHIRYALTINPTVYVSNIRQFWSTARIETTNEGTKILATVDGQFSHQWKFLIHTIMQCLSPKSTGFNEFSSNIATTVGEGSGTPTEPHHTPSPEAQQSPHHDLSSSLSPTASIETIPTETPSEIPTIRQYSRRATRIAQPKALPTAADELASILRDDNLYTRLQRQQTEMATKIKAQDLEISSLKARIKLLEDNDKGTVEPSADDVPINGRSLETGEEAGVERNVSAPPAADGSTVGVPTGSGLVPTVSAIFTTASVVTPYSRRKGKEKMVESDMPKKKKLQEQIDIARDAKIARIQAEEEQQILIDGLDRNNEIIAKYLQEYEQFATYLTIGKKIELINELVKYQDHYAKILKYQAQQRKFLSKKEQREIYMSILKSHARWKTKHFRGMTLKEIREKFIPVWNQIEDFVPMALKEEGERIKRKGLKLEEGSAKKMKTSENVSEEDRKDMMQLVPVEEVCVEALQVKHPIIDWEIHIKGKRDYWKIIRLGGHTALYHFFVDMLKQLDREDLNQLWILVKETLSIRQASSDKEKELWVKLKRIFEPDLEDQLWTHTQAMMHDLVEWRLFHTYGVHHVFTRDQEMFMLVERDYPLRRELAIVMISNKIQVENDSQMANDLIMKIHNIANSPR